MYFLSSCGCVNITQLVFLLSLFALDVILCVMQCTLETTISIIWYYPFICLSVSLFRILCLSFLPQTINTAVRLLMTEEQTIRGQLAGQAVCWEAGEGQVIACCPSVGINTSNWHWTMSKIILDSGEGGLGCNYCDRLAAWEC